MKKHIVGVVLSVIALGSFVGCKSNDINEPAGAQTSGRSSGSWQNSSGSQTNSQSQPSAWATGNPANSRTSPSGSGSGTNFNATGGTGQP